MYEDRSGSAEAYPKHSLDKYTERLSAPTEIIGKVEGGKISSVDAIKALVTMCDMTHKPLYFDEKLESGGNSHEMIKL